MIFESFPVGPLQCNCSILGDEATSRAVVIDPGGDAERIVAEVEGRGLTVTHILHTHAHIDHVGATNEVARRCGGETRMHKGDEWLVENLDEQCRWAGFPTMEPIRIDHWMGEGERVDVGGSALEVLHTPGHSPGSCTFTVELDGRQLVFAGDTLFMGSIGRTDLWGGDTDLIMTSLKGKLMELDDDAEVVCGHGPSTTIGAERRSNPFITGSWRLG